MASIIDFHADSREQNPEACDPDDLLRQIGLDLDERKTLRVGGGKVWPSAGRPQYLLGNSLGVMEDGETTKARAEGSATGSRQGAAADSTAGSRPTGAAASFLSELGGWSSEARNDLRKATDAHGLAASVAPPGVWLRGVVTPIHGSAVAATLAVGVPVDPLKAVQAWAWWVSDGEALGPRHTNYPHASICSFEPTDVAAWSRKEPLMALLDFHLVWIVRHMHLRRFGRWPGPQILHTAFERLTEGKPNELCAGCESGRRYKNCCRPRDLRLTPEAVRAEFGKRFPNSRREAPKDFATCIALGEALWAEPSYARHLRNVPL